MQKFKFIISIAIISFLFPLLSIAQDINIDEVASTGNEVISTGKGALSTGLSLFDHAWNYKVISLDNQSITFSTVILAIIALIVGMRAARYASVYVKKKLFKMIQLDKNSSNVIGRLIDYAFLSIIIIIVLDVAEVPLTLFKFIGGAFVISIGLSAQHLINNFISGVVLIVEGRVRVGDLIEFRDIIGRVESIDSRAVEVKTQANVGIFIPHSQLMQEVFSVWTHNDDRVRISTVFKIEQKDDIDNSFEDVIINAVMENRNILATPKPELLLTGFEDNLLCYEVRFWINLSYIDRRIILSEVNSNIISALKVHNIPLAIPNIRYTSI